MKNIPVPDPDRIVLRQIVDEAQVVACRASCSVVPRLSFAPEVASEVRRCDTHSPDWLAAPPR